MQSGDEEVLRACVVEFEGGSLATAIRPGYVIVSIAIVSPPIIFQDKLRGYACASVAGARYNPVPFLLEPIDRADAMTLIGSRDGAPYPVRSTLELKKGEPIEYVISSPVSRGAPVVVNGRLAGVVVDRNRVVPISVVLQRLEFEDLDQFAKDAISRAESIRIFCAAPKIHMEHYVHALGFLADDEVRRSVEQVVKKVPLPAEYPRLVSVAEMPPMSGHVRKAFDAAIEGRDGYVTTLSDLRRGALSVTECNVIHALDLPVPLPPRPFEIAGIASDLPTADHDPFNVSEQAKALCSVLAAREVVPPVSVGLFAPWGSGKTSFMRAMERHFDDINRASQKDDDSIFCSNIVQLSFNAWHYIEQNLVASLANAVFEGLDAALALSTASADIVDDASYQRRRLEEQLLVADGNAARKQQEADNARAESEAIDREIETLKSDDSAVEARMTISDALAPAAEDAKKKLKTDVEVDELLRDVHGLYDAARIFFSSPATLGRLWLLLALLLVAIPLWWTTLQWLGVTAALGALAGSYGWMVKPIAEAVASLNKARKDAAKTIEDKRQSLLEEKARQKTTAENKALAAEEAAQKARNEKSGIERQIDRLSPVYSMAEFVRERQASGAYTRELSVVATAHRDFRRLSAFLKKIGIAQPEEERLQSIRPIDRIVLYIDDLDRCPEAKVMEVLQATHLLLAFDLFVVIVAVDSKWLLHSIQASGWHVPINYLEKIIQIPFVLEPMDSGGYENFIDVLTETPKRQPKPKRKLSAPPPPPAPTPAPVEFVSGGGTPQPQPQPTPPPPPEKKEPERPAIDPRPPQLLFTDDEKKFMKSLLELMTSARNTKRFVNIYRLIRATLPAARFAMLIDAQKKAYEPLQVLVAVVTNHPAVAASLLAALQASAADATWSEFIAPSPLSHDLTEAGKAFAIGERPVSDFQEWICMASRFLIKTDSR